MKAPVNTPNGFSIFADQRTVSSSILFDNMDSSVAFMFEFMTYGDVENFLFHERLTFPGARVRYLFDLDGKVNQAAFVLELQTKGGELMRGKIVRYKVTDGWWRHGFIICIDGRISHFDHYGIAEGFEIGPGQQVEFDLAKSSHWKQGKLTATLDENGSIAVNVRPVR